MCGLAGFLGFGDIGSPKDTLNSMTTAISHRGPDDSGIWIDDHSGVGLGHRRLSILDLSPAGHQPMHSMCGRYVIVFNGEIYNFHNIRAELEKNGVASAWRGHSDTEVILAAVSFWGIAETLPRLTGMFAIALWDRQTSTLCLARDRLGEKPLYYGWLGDTFVFGSELKSLRAHPHWQGEINRSALALFVRHSYVPAPFSIYKDVYKLPPGTFLCLEPNRRDQRRATPASYWSMKNAAESGIRDPVELHDDQAIDELERLLSAAIKRQMIADVPLGAFLSGGIDSSAIVALMQAQSNRPVKTFTIGFHETGYNEAQHAKAVANYLRTEHTELYVSPADAMSVIPKLPVLYDEPFSDSSQIPMFLVAQLARAHVTVTLSGDGGDELFGGYNRYTWAASLWNKMRWVPRSLRAVAAACLFRVPPKGWDTVFEKISAVLPATSKHSAPGDKIHKLASLLRTQNPEEMYLGFVSHWEWPNELVIGAAEPKTALTDPDAWAILPDFVQRMMYLDSVTYLPDDILAKVDRAAMGVSLETRVPMLDHNVVEFAWRLPAQMKIRNGQGKWILRQVLNRHVPPKLVARPKMGFGIPLDTWLRGPLRDWAENLLNESRLRSEGYFNPEPIREKWRQHLSGERNWQYHLWDILMFQAWLEGEQKRTTRSPREEADRNPPTRLVVS